MMTGSSVQADPARPNTRYRDDKSGDSTKTGCLAPLIPPQFSFLFLRMNVKLKTSASFFLFQPSLPTRLESGANLRRRLP
jgi:hypothetical protein